MELELLCYCVVVCLFVNNCELVDGKNEVIMLIDSGW